MLNEQIEHLQRTAYEGLLAPSQSVAIGCLLALLAAWLLWRERQVLGRWWPLFWTLRIGALGLALWMLAGPTHLAIRRVTSPQSIAVLVDDTGSMDVTDPPSPTDDLRWRLAAGKSEPTPLELVVLLSDRAGVQLTEAVFASNLLLDGVGEHLASRKLKSQQGRVRRAVEASRRLLLQASKIASRNDELFADRLDRVITLLDETATPMLDRVEREIDGSSTPNQDSLNTATETLNTSLAGARRRGQSLARDAALRAAEGSGALAGVNVTRRERVEAVLAKLEQEVLARIEQTCIVHRMRFSQFAGLANDEVTLGDVEIPSLTPVASQPIDKKLVPAGYDQGAASPIPSTDLAAALQQVELLRSVGPLRMALLLSDGQHNAPGAINPQEVASRIAATPINPTPIGVSTPVRDIMITRVEAPARVVRKDTATIEVLLTALDCDGEAVEVILTSEGEELDRKPLAITNDWQDSRVTFRIDTNLPGSDALGTREYEIEVGSVSEEASLTNNLGIAAIEVVRNKLRVLIADRGPRYEYRYLQQLFRRDKHVDLDELLILPSVRATGSRATSGLLPNHVEGWDEYDVVILGDLPPSMMGEAEQESLMEFVQHRGGSVILIAGGENMPQRYVGQPLNDLLPVRVATGITNDDGFGVTLTDDARLASCVELRESFRDSQAAWQNAYARLPIYGLSSYCRPKPNARVLVEATPIDGVTITDEAEQLAFFCWHPVGAGKVAYLAAPQSYQLRFLRGDQDHHRFWGQTLRWITAEQGGGRDSVRIDTDRAQYKGGQAVEVTVWLRDPQGRPVSDALVSAEARSLDQTAARVPLRREDQATGRYVGVFENLSTGAYQIVPTGDIVATLLAGDSDTQPRKLINIEPPGDIEMVNTQCDLPLLKQIAELTGGHLTPPTALAELLEVASLDPEISESPPRRTPLWNRWSYLVIIASCLLTEWVVRKAKGLT